MRLHLSLRAKFLLIVVAAAVIPLGLIGLWLTRSAARSGRELLETRLRGALDRTGQDVGGRWLRHRAELLTLTEDPAVQRLLRSGSPRSGIARDTGTDRVRRAFSTLLPAVQRVDVVDAEGTRRLTLGPAEPAVSSDEPASATVNVRLPVYANGSGRALGALDVRMQSSALLGVGTAVAAGAIIAAVDRATGAPLLPLPFDPALLERDEFQWGGDRWITARRVLEEPPIELVATAPLNPFTEPFDAAARRGTLVLLAVAVVSVVLAVALTRRMTQALARLAGAAEAVARGDLDLAIDAPRADEVGRVAQAFNLMTANLRRTLDQLALSRALAQMGEFAASLAHEVRNPLTSIRLDLQRVEETLATDSKARALQARALAEVERLDRAVSGSLRIARSGKIERSPLNLLAPVRSAAETAQPAFAARGGTLRPLETASPEVRIMGDAAALQQLFLNLLLNAAQALDAGGEAVVVVEERAGEVAVTVRDTGGGIPPDQLGRVFEPFYSTKPTGTGLGLAIARQIAIAHGGEITLESRVGEGTAVRVRLPRSILAVTT